MYEYPERDETVSFSASSLSLQTLSHIQFECVHNEQATNHTALVFSAVAEVTICFKKIYGLILLPSAIKAKRKAIRNRSWRPIGL
jgi:hypothetical protein